MSRKFSYF